MNGTRVSHVPTKNQPQPATGYTETGTGSRDTTTAGQRAAHRLKSQPTRLLVTRLAWPPYSIPIRHPHATTSTPILPKDYSHLLLLHRSTNQCHPDAVNCAERSGETAMPTRPVPSSFWRLPLSPPLKIGMSRPFALASVLCVLWLALAPTTVPSSALAGLAPLAESPFGSSSPFDSLGAGISSGGCVSCKALPHWRPSTTARPFWPPSRRWSATSA